MKTLKTILIATLTIGIISFANAEEKAKEGSVPVNLNQSEIVWNGKKVTGEHFGNVDIKSGSLEFDDGVLKGGSFVIDMSSIKVTDLEGQWKTKLENHLKSDDFFGVEKYPTSKLAITKVEPKGKDGAYKITGDLTIKATTKPIQFDALMDGSTATADIVIDRAEYDVRYGSGSFFDNLGDKTIYDDFILKVKLVTE